ncbi:MAG: helix-turn-helix domain-containing protein [Deltaproteobacteria bacterium]|jgi:transcriptional regulator with XRE-family HTH domain|nr:helix-turn-helix domain-containing protein [Deltaproteobacteria bacterium]
MKKIFSQRLKHLRADMTQEALANAVGVSLKRIQDWEQGRSKPNLNALIKLANYFNVSIDQLLGLADLGVLKAEKALLGQKIKIPPWLNPLLPYIDNLSSAERKAIKTIIQVFFTAKTKKS